MYQFKIPVEELEKLTLTLSFLGVENYALFENEDSPKSEFYDADSFPIAKEFILETDEHIEELKQLGFAYAIKEPEPYLEEKPQPIVIGPFVINPDASTSSKVIPIVLEGAMAFGTGHHQTTKLCLLALEDLKGEGVQSVLDLGCGTGILAIAADKLFHPSVLHASDIDPIAIDIAAHNFKINHLHIKNLDPSTSLRMTSGDNHHLSLFLSEGFQNIPNRSYDLIIANILLNPLCDMAADMMKHSSRYLLLSGIIDSQKDDLLSAFKNCTVVKEYQLDEWLAFVLQVT